jgi:excisionase family DNA binding protein
MSNLPSKTVLTTGEVASICKVAARTVSKWIDTGRLEGYRIPGSRDRRVTREALDRFIRDNRLPTDGIAASGSERVLVVDADTATAATLAETLAQETGREARTARTAFEAGVACSRFAPDWMFVDASVGMSEIVGLVSVLRAEGSPCRVVVMGHTFLAQDETALRNAGVGQVLRKPFTLRAAVDLLDRRRYAAAG